MSWTLLGQGRAHGIGLGLCLSPRTQRDGGTPRGDPARQKHCTISKAIWLLMSLTLLSTEQGQASFIVLDAFGKGWSGGWRYH